MTLESVFSDFLVNMHGVIMVCLDDTVVSTNQETLLGKTMQEMQTPFIISGKNIKKEGEFHESMMQYDVASTIAHIFGLKQPQVWIGRPMLQVFK